MKNETLTIIVIGILLITNFSMSIISTGISPTKKVNSNLTDYTNSDVSRKETKTSGLNLKPGDIVWRWVDAETFPLFQFFMHPLMCTGCIGDNYEFIEANGVKDVWIRMESERWIKNNNIFDFVYRVKDEIASDADIQNAIDFAKSQEGKKFAPLFDLDTFTFHKKNSNPNDPDDPLSDAWYCTEIIWAAYDNQGIDIDSNKGSIVMPFDIHTSPYLDKIPLEGD
jgi:uncharacterized protein YycO